MISEEVVGGAEAEVGGGAGAAFTARANGATLRQAAAAAGVSRTAGHYWLAQSGGVRPRARRPRPALRLSLDERETISRGLAQKKTLTAIAGELGRSVSTISREVRRNSGPNGYRAARADRLAVRPAARAVGRKQCRRPAMRKRPSWRKRARQPDVGRAWVGDDLRQSANSPQYIHKRPMLITCSQRCSTSLEPSNSGVQRALGAY